MPQLINREIGSLGEPMAIFQRIKDIHRRTRPIRGLDPVFSIPCADPPCFWMDVDGADGGGAVGQGKDRRHPFAAGVFSKVWDLPRNDSAYLCRDPPLEEAHHPGMFWEHHWEEYVTWLTGYMDYVEGVCKCLAAYEEQTLAYDSCDAFGPLLDAVRGKAAKAFGWDSGWDEEMKSVGSDRQVAYITTALTGLLDMSPHCDSTLRSYLDPLLIAQALATPSHSYTQLPPPFDNGTIQDYVAHLLNAGITLSKLSLPLDKGEGLPTWTLPGTALSGLFGALVAALVSTTVILFISLLWGLL